MKFEDLIERTRFYKGDETPPPAMGNMVGLYWDYERVWVKGELGTDESFNEAYKDMIMYFQRFILKNSPIRTDVPLGLQAIFANRIEHWGSEHTTLEAVNRFIDDYLKTATVYEKEV